MTQPNTSEPRRGATVAQLKDDIDSGRTGDKLAGFDPGAAPLGVDEEAGGAPYDPELVAATRVAEVAGRPNSPRPNASTPELQPNARMGPQRNLILAVVAGVGGAALLAFLLFAAL